MNLPAGEMLKQGAKLGEFETKNEIELLADKLFSGYVVVTAEGYGGIEEGVLLFKKGILIGSQYEYNKYGITIYGDPAVPQTFNLFVSQHGIIDVVQLTVQQVELVLAFNEVIKTTREIQKKDFGKYYAKQFTDRYAKEVLAEVMKEKYSKHDIFKKLGLAGIESK